MKHLNYRERIIGIRGIHPDKLRAWVARASNPTQKDKRKRLMYAYLYGASFQFMNLTKW